MCVTQSNKNQHTLWFWCFKSEIKCYLLYWIILKCLISDSYVLTALLLIMWIIVSLRIILYTLTFSVFLCILLLWDFYIKFESKEKTDETRLVWRYLKDSEGYCCDRTCTNLGILILNTVFHTSNKIIFRSTPEYSNKFLDQD